MPIESLEKIATACVAVTARALVETAGPELTFLGWRTLVVVDSGNQQMRMSELALCLGLSRPAASKLVRRLVRKGLIKLTADPGDGRVVLLSLSEEGTRWHRAVVDRRLTMLAESMSDSPSFLTSFDTEALVVVASRLSKWT
jgi:DNA-binding MarR family transcriptional regulator